MKRALLILLLAAPLRAEDPGLELDPDGRLVLHSLPAVLAEELVRPHLTRGLTATFLFRVDPQGLRIRRQGSGARVEIRYELWDEVFHVAAGTADGAVDRRELDSFGELELWWRDLRLVVAGATYLDGLDPPPRRQARVELDLVPFSQAEQIDAQRWFSDSLDEAAKSGAEEVAESAEQPAGTLDRTFHLLMATSIRRPALVSYRWTVPIEVGSL